MHTYPHEVHIQNIVSSTQIANGLDLDSLTDKLSNAKYEKSKFPGLIHKASDPVATFLFFESGKIVCTGTKLIDDTMTAVDKMVNHLSQFDIDIIKNPDVRVQNVVASTYVNQNLNLNAIAIGFNLENVEYEPEQFPGLVYRLDDPHIVVLMFSSGKVVITGGKKPDDCIRGMDVIYNELCSIGLIHGVD